jgi:transglutaminase-like putative cysteine protease
VTTRTPTRSLPELRLAGEDLETLLAPSPSVESEHSDVVAFAREHAAGATSDVDKAVKLYYAVRDGVRYDPYKTILTVDGLKASTTLETRRAWCVPKAVLLAACCRAEGIPARLGFADVRNHLSTKRMRETMKTDVFYWHGYTSIYLEDQWVKATPAFNVELCEKFGLLPLEFDGREDSLYHPFDKAGRRHMEYLRYRGEYADIPIDEIIATFSEFYPYMKLLSSGSGSASTLGADADFDRDVELETRTDEDAGS